MNPALIFSGAVLGLASGGHCIAMCGAGSSYFLGSTQPLTPRAVTLRLTSFHAGRIMGYAFVGALLGGAAAAFHALTEWVTLLRPLWTMANTAMFLLGMTLLITARQPHVLATIGQTVGRWFQGCPSVSPQPLRFHPRVALASASTQGTGVAGIAAATPLRSDRKGLAVGLSWAFIPCGPLYSAWTLALFAGDPLSGALTAAAFAIASGMQLALAQWWFGRYGQGRRDTRSVQGGRWDRAGVRVAGAALCFSAGYSVIMLVSGGEAAGLFCL